MTAFVSEAADWGPAGIVGLLRESVLHRYAQCCNVVRERLLIDQQKQSVNTQDLDSGGRGRKFESSHPDQSFQRVSETQRRRDSYGSPPEVHGVQCGTCH